MGQKRVLGALRKGQPSGQEGQDPRTGNAMTVGMSLDPVKEQLGQGTWTRQCGTADHPILRIGWGAGQ